MKQTPLNIWSFLIRKQNQCVITTLKIINWVLLLAFSIQLICYAEQFHESRQWLNLHYYEKTGDGYLSLADSNQFFVSKNGRTNPEAEYIKALALSKKQDRDFREKFPLRYKIITQVNNLSYEPLVFPDPDIQDIQIVYPNQYLSNPASMFGHLFLLLRSKNGITDSTILHYVADTGDVGSLGYIPGGLTGKFEGRYLMEPYYKKIKQYNYVDDRQIIYYDLVLTKKSINNLQLHAIELKQTHFNYYFLNENCAFFIGKLLNVVLEEDVVSLKSLILPSQIVNTLHDKFLLSSEYHRKPGTQLFNDYYSNLNRSQRVDVIDLILKKTTNIPSDQNTLKSFLYISDYLINNYPRLTPVIRYNRIRAFKELRKQGDVNIRPSLQKQNEVSKIKSKKISLDYELYNRFSIYYSPVYYRDISSFNMLQTKEMDLLSSGVIIDSKVSPLYTLTLIDIINTSQYNKVLNAYSWRVNSFFAYKKKLLTDQSFESGFSYNIKNQSVVFGFLGFNYASYDQVKDEALNNLQLNPSMRVGVKQKVFDENTNWSVSYNYRYRHNYIALNLTHHGFKAIHQVSYSHGYDFDKIKLSTIIPF
ncbi:hypothetical protein DID80_04975 [Candidatus Marinamargulisbacteria bacterium SCGC AAA071-K20]|nr:hypothetical protein DID80_04975 [Candidatus Marinamargulisbacteria bacterium SCGC AAA071-K20]